MALVSLRVSTHESHSTLSLARYIYARPATLLCHILSEHERTSGIDGRAHPIKTTIIHKISSTSIKECVTSEMATNIQYPQKCLSSLATGIEAGRVCVYEEGEVVVAEALWSFIFFALPDKQSHLLHLGVTVLFLLCQFLDHLD